MSNSLGSRMKGYENVTRNYLTRRMPVIIRIDGKAFHTFTKKLEKPFDMILIETMWETCKYLCANIQGCKVAYTQSDEISLLLTDYESIDTFAWFENNIQKMVSVSASMATLAFNKCFEEVYSRYVEEDKISIAMQKVYESKFFTALFDSRVYNVPKEDVCNYFIWRQQDSTRNSIQMVGRANFNHSELKGKSCDEVQEMLSINKGLNWNDIPAYQKRGACIFKEQYLLDNEQQTPRNRWSVDKDIPIFAKYRVYIEKYL